VVTCAFSGAAAVAIIVIKTQQCDSIDDSKRNLLLLCKCTDPELYSEEYVSAVLSSISFPEFQKHQLSAAI
jgi:methylaspartate ammonia-lyase